MISPEFGFAGILVLFAKLNSKLILVLSIIVILSFLNFYIMLAFLALNLLNIYLNKRLNNENVDIDRNSANLRRKCDYYKELPNKKEAAKEIRINGL